MKKIVKSILFILLVSLFCLNAKALQPPSDENAPAALWYSDYVQKLADEKIIDTTENFRPDDPINRAELVKMVMLATNGMADYENPGVPTFADVPEDAWYFDYVEQAVQKGIVTGYSDADGNLTGMFGPGDAVSRAEATKILVKAFNLPETLTPVPSFTDVEQNDWFYKYVLTAYNQSVIDGYGNGYFGPADRVTRAQIAKMIVNSGSPKVRT